MDSGTTLLSLEELQDHLNTETLWARVDRWELELSAGPDREEWAEVLRDCRAGKFWATMAVLVHCGPVSGADFAPFVGERNWLVFDRAEALGAECEEWCSGIVYGFRVRRVRSDGRVVIYLELG